MRRMISAVVVGLLAIPMVALSAPDSIKEIMKAAHGKTAPLVGKVSSEAKAKKWDDAAKDAATLKENADALAGLKPKKGSEDSWKKQTDAYKENMAALTAAVEKKDEKAVATAVSTIAGSCKACHIDVDVQIVCAGMLLTLIMGRLGGLVPSLSAMRLKILDSLR